MIKKKSSIIFFAIYFLSTFTFANPSNYIYPFKYPTFSNYGTIGLIQNPTSRFLREGTLALTWSHYEPYLRGSIVAYPFSWFEAAYQYTDVNNVLYSDVPEFSGSQTLKDKSFDAKILLLGESGYLPQVAIGLRDLGGTGRFSSEFLVFNKLILPNLDISFGIGWGNLNGNRIDNPLAYISEEFNLRNQGSDLGGKVNLKNFFSGDAGYFAGLEYFIPRMRGIRFKAEFDGTNYQTESSPLNQSSKINVGIVYPLNNDLAFKLSYARGNTINFGFSYALSLGDKNPRKIQKEKVVSVSNPEATKLVTSRSEDNLYRASLLYLGRDGFNLQKLSIDESQIHAVFSQSKYSNPVVASGRSMSILNDISPDNIRILKVSEINGGLGMYSAEIYRDSFERNKTFNSPQTALNQLKITSFRFKEDGHEYNPITKYPAYFIEVGPDLRSQIGGPDGFFFGDLKLAFDSEILLKRNLSLIGIASYGLYDNMDDLKLGPNSDFLPNVRTNITEYQKQSREFSIRRLQLNYFHQFSDSWYFKFSGGIFESMFNGFGFESLYRPFNRSYGLGIEAWQVYQREFDQMFDVREYQTLTGHLTFYYQEPRTNILFKVKGGKYLAKDSGFTFDFSRVFRSGLRIGAYFSLTDISFEEFGEGSFDKGFYFWVPVHLFSERYFKKNFGWGLRPLTRDGAQSIVVGHPLWGVTDASSKHEFLRKISDFYD